MKILGLSIPVEKLRVGMEVRRGGGGGFVKGWQKVVRVDRTDKRNGSRRVELLGSGDHGAYNLDLGTLLFRKKGK